MYRMLSVNTQHAFTAGEASFKAELQVLGFDSMQIENEYYEMKETGPINFI